MLNNLYEVRFALDIATPYRNIYANSYGEAACLFVKKHAYRDAVAEGSMFEVEVLSRTNSGKSKTKTIKVKAVFAFEVVE